MRRMGWIVLALLLLSGCVPLLSDAGGQESAAVPAMAQTAEGPQSATYADVLNGLLRRWGGGTGRPLENGGYRMTGLWLVRLLDLNRDGVQELLVRYGAETPEPVDRAELWTIAKGGARRLYIGPGRTGPDGGASLVFYGIGGQWQLCTGSIGIRTDLAVYGLSNGRLEHLHALTENGKGGGAERLVDGIPVGREEFAATMQAWEETALIYAPPQDEAGLQALLTQTAETLDRFLPIAGN